MIEIIEVPTSGYKDEDYSTIVKDPSLNSY